MARIAYIRVSTEEQDTMRQEDLMAGQNIDRYYIEKISGKNADRPQLKAMMDYVREGDVVVVVSYSRFSRSTADPLNLVGRRSTSVRASASRKGKEAKQRRSWMQNGKHEGNRL